MKKILSLLIMLLSFSLFGCSIDKDSVIPDHLDLVGMATRTTDSNIDKSTDEIHDVAQAIDEEGFFTTAEDVALFISNYKRLPNNYLTRSEAIDLGWVSTQGNLWDVTDEMSIGGDHFYNQENQIQLPYSNDRIYYECDVNYVGGYRGAERIIFTNDGFIYYTTDHYETFTLLYGDV